MGWFLFCMASHPSEQVIETLGRISHFAPPTNNHVTYSFAATGVRGGERNIRTIGPAVQFQGRHPNEALGVLHQGDTSNVPQHTGRFAQLE